jgi:hypothetical protein
VTRRRRASSSAASARSLVQLRRSARSATSVVWRTDLAPAAQAQHGWRDPADLRVVDHPVPATIAGRGSAPAMSTGWLKDIAGDAAPGQPVLRRCSTRRRSCSSASSTPRCVFNSRETADNLKKSGAFIPGIRPGEQTAAVHRQDPDAADACRRRSTSRWCVCCPSSWC